MAYISESIFFLGAGAMAEALIRGFTDGKAIHPNRILVTNRNHPERLQSLAERYGVQPHPALSGIRDCRIVVLAAKPADCAAALAQALPHLDGQVLISLAAGVTLATLRQHTADRARVVRTMPNIPVAVGAGVIGVAFDERLSNEDKQLVMHLLTQTGDAVEIPESMMDALTAVSGSGPGFLSYLLEAMEQSAIDLGFNPPLARRLVLQTLLGTAKTLSEWGMGPGELRRRVTSPNGTTAAGLQQLEAAGVASGIGQALRAAAARSAEMAKAYAKIERP